MTDWAREHEFSGHSAYAVQFRKPRCTRERGHQIAVALGMKRSVEETSP